VFFCRWLIISLIARAKCVCHLHDYDSAGATYKNARASAQSRPISPGGRENPGGVAAGCGRVDSNGVEWEKLFNLCPRGVAWPRNGMNAPYTCRPVIIKPGKLVTRHREKIQPI